MNFCTPCNDDYADILSVDHSTFVRALCFGPSIWEDAMGEILKLSRECGDTARSPGEKQNIDFYSAIADRGQLLWGSGVM